MKAKIMAAPGGRGPLADSAGERANHVKKSSGTSAEPRTPNAGEAPVQRGPSANEPARDDTTVAVMQESLERVQDELLAFHRLAMLGTMSAMVAHEFNNLATPVLARAEDALARDDVPAMRKALERTVINTQKSIAIAQHLLGLAKATDATLAPCSVARAVREALDAAARPLDKDRIELLIDVPEEITVLARPILLEQVLLNLFLNARNAMKGSNGRVRVSARPDGDFVIIDVSDTGIGIPPDRLETLFKPFLSSEAGDQSPDWHPIGLGLNVCRTIATQHGATIDAIPNDGPGCTFRLRWPAPKP